MFRSLAIVVLAFLNTTSAFSKEVEGAIRCDVENIYLLTMKDGSSQQYGGYEDGPKKGDSIIFNYTYNQFGTSISKDFSIRIPRGSKPIFNLSSNINKRNTTEKKQFPGTFFGTRQYDGEGSENLVISNDSIYADGIGGELELTRYFKNDWHGFLTDGRLEDAIHVMALDCRHVLDGLESAIEDLKQSGF